MKVHVSFLLVICVLLHTVQSANILFYFGFSSYSHRISVWQLVTALADRGHNVTFLSPHHVKDIDRHPKVHEFLPKEVEDALIANPPFNESSIFINRVKHGRFHQGGGGMLIDIGVKVCKLFLSAKETQQLLATTKFDLVVIDGLFNDCAYGIVYKLNPHPKVMLYGTSNIFSWWYDAFGVLPEASSIADPIVAFPTPMNFLQRTFTALFMPFSYYMKVWLFYPKLEAVLRETLQIPDMPPIVELERNTSLVLMNSHFSEEYARSLPPMFVSVGGLHIKEGDTSPQKIPDDMQKFLDESGEEGFIYVSFGSIAQMSTAPPEVQNVFFEAFKNTKCRFLFKWEVDRPKELPANVFTSKWMPQQRVLRHPKIKAFVTHGGMMSLSEAVQNTVPVIMFPVFAEQDFNAMRFGQAKRGITLEISTVTSEQLQNAFDEIRVNPIYKTNMRKVRELYNDRPQKPLDTAVWWTEYILRHEDLSSMKPLSMNQWWYERRLLDVWAFIAGIVLLIISTVLYVFKKLLWCIFSRGGDQSHLRAQPQSKRTNGTSTKKVKKN